MKIRISLFDLNDGSIDCIFNDDGSGVIMRHDYKAVINPWDKPTYKKFCERLRLDIV